ncbi:hypothetical protein NKH18_01190 [Streptomyces sp. M10(2022)]
MSALTGMRASELTELLVGCRVKSEEDAPGLTRHRIASKVIRAAAGAARGEWVVVDEVVHAIELAEKLTDAAPASCCSGRSTTSTAAPPAGCVAGWARRPDNGWGSPDSRRCDPPTAAEAHSRGRDGGPAWRHPGHEGALQAPDRGDQ